MRTYSLSLSPFKDKTLLRSIAQQEVEKKHKNYLNIAYFDSQKYDLFSLKFQER